MRRAGLACNYYELDPREPNSEKPFSWHKCGKPGVRVEEWGGKPAYRCPEHTPEALKDRREHAWREQQKGWEQLGRKKMAKYDESTIGFDGVPGHSPDPNDYGPRYPDTPRRKKGKQKVTADGNPIYDVMALVGDEQAGDTAHWLRVGIAFGGQNNDGIKIKVEAVPHRWNGTIYIYPRYE